MMDKDLENEDIQNLTKCEKNKATSEKRKEKLKSKIPHIFVMPNNKLSNRITKETLKDCGLDIIISGVKSKKEITTKVLLNYENKNVQLESYNNYKFTAYDREVYDGVATLYEAGNNTITPTMVYRAMNGLTETEYISETAIMEVRTSLDKSTRIRTIIDYTDEAKMYNHKIDKTTYEGYLLACDKITVVAGGVEQEAYKLLRKPILYEYSQVSGQIITVPINLLQTKNTVRSTEDVIVIRGYLIRQIEWIKNNKSQRSSNITYQGIYEELDVLRTNHDERAYGNKTSKIRSHVNAILNLWKEQNYINDFEEYKDGNTIRGIKVIMNKQ